MRCKSFICYITALIAYFLATVPTYGATYYVSPTGNDSAAGSTTAPWATFSRSWQSISRGDTLILKDGEYRQQLMPQVPSDNGSVITIKAEHDGKAIVNGDLNGDGKGDVVTADLVFWAPYNSIRITLEGLIIKNSIGSVVHVDGGNSSSYITLRRVSVYNADPDKNVNAIELFQTNNNLIEDSIAAGSGRKMILMYKSNNNIIRRNFAHWNRWDGREWCSIGYPYGTDIEIYYGNNNIVENNISYALTPDYLFGFKSTGGETTTNTTNGNIFAGNIGFYSGKKYDQSPIDWNVRPQPNSCNYDSAITEESNRTGFWVERDGVTQNNIIKDNFIYGNAALGFDLSKWEQTNSIFSGNTLTYNTFIGNGSDNPCGSAQCPLGGVGTDAVKSHLDQFGDISTNKIGKVYVSGDQNNRVFTSINGTGARLSYRYNNGSLTATSLWPWPMEDRIKTELPLHLGAPALSIASTIYPILSQYGAVSSNITPNPTSPVTPGVTVTPTCNLKTKGDGNCDNLIDLSDFEQWRKEYSGTLSSKASDFDGNGKIDIGDFEAWRKGYFGI